MTSQAEDDKNDNISEGLAAGTKLLLGQYTITGHLGEGGFGITYLAHDSLGRDVVIKECFPAVLAVRDGTNVIPRAKSFTDEYQHLVDLFVHEAYNLARLKHPNIVGVGQVFEENNTAYMSLDLVYGQDLQIYAESPGQFGGPMKIWQLLNTLLETLTYLHGEKMLHRDISPDNIIVGEDERPVLIDFGASAWRGKISRAVRTSILAVKDGYSPPESYQQGEERTAESDIYSLAATIYHLVSGEVAIDSERRISALAKGEDDPYRTLVGRIEGYDDEFLATIDKAMSVKPADRFRSAKEWQDMLKKPVEDTAVSESEAEESEATASSALDMVMQLSDQLEGLRVEAAKIDVSEEDIVDEDVTDEEIAEEAESEDFVVSERELDEAFEEELELEDNVLTEHADSVFDEPEIVEQAAEPEPEPETATEPEDSAIYASEFEEPVELEAEAAVEPELIAPEMAEPEVEPTVETELESPERAARRLSEALNSYESPFEAPANQSKAPKLLVGMALIAAVLGGGAYFALGQKPGEGETGFETAAVTPPASTPIEPVESDPAPTAEDVAIAPAPTPIIEETPAPTTEEAPAPIETVEAEPEPVAAETPTPIEAAEAEPAPVVIEEVVPAETFVAEPVDTAEASAPAVTGAVDSAPFISAPRPRPVELVENSTSQPSAPTVPLSDTPPAAETGADELAPAPAEIEVAAAVPTTTEGFVGSGPVSETPQLAEPAQIEAATTQVTTASPNSILSVDEVAPVGNSPTGLASAPGRFDVADLPSTGINAAPTLQTEPPAPLPVEEPVAETTETAAVTPEQSAVEPSGTGTTAEFSIGDYPFPVQTRIELPFTLAETADGLMIIDAAANAPAWAFPGSLVSEVNGTDVTTIAEFESNILSNAEVSTSGEWQVNFELGSAPASIGSAVVSTEGLRLETERTAEGWQTVVTQSPYTDNDLLLVGDTLVMHLDSGQNFDGALSMVEILADAVNSGTSSMNLFVDRDGQNWAISLDPSTFVDN